MGLRIEKAVPLAPYTTLQVGGVADHLAVVKTVEELGEALRFAKQTATPPLILGGGSNVLISDFGYRGLVIVNQISGRQYEEEGDEVLLTCGAGEVLDTVVADTATRGYWGLENLSAIPGTIGATPIQNVGAYGVEISDLVTKVVAVHVETTEEKVFTKADCQFGYRDSFFKTTAGREWIVTSVTFRLSCTSAPQLEYGALAELEKTAELTPQQVRDQVVAIRSEKFPDWQRVGTAGSFFKNPIISNAQFTALQKDYPGILGYPMGDTKTKVSLGWVLDNVCSLRGYCRDGVCLYERQALVLVHESPVSAKAIDEFATYVANMVKEKTGIVIEREVRSV